MDIEIFEKEILRNHPNAIRASVGDFSGFHYVVETPAHEFKIFDLLIEGLGFIHVVSRDSFDDVILEQLVKAFERIKIKTYKKDTLYVYSTYEQDKFDCIGIAPPSVSEVYKDTSPSLSKYAYWVFPMFGIEFLQGFSKDQFWAQMLRKDKWRVKIVNWNRRITVEDQAANHEMKADEK